MVTHQRIDTGSVGRRYLDEISDERGIQGLWVHNDDDVFEMWLIVDRIDADTERRLYGSSIVLHDDFPEASFDIHVLNPRHYREGTDLRSLLPSGAQPVSPA